ncbi:MAG: hypothetical protein Q8L41_08685 [Anaerolineales bacterium]|nr:hypothetical protein [Anaerolineales bacterium]
MSDLLKRLAYLQTRRDRTPNLDLARDLVARNDTAGIREIAENMWSENKNIHWDCIHVMYEIGAIEPNLIAQYAEDFIKLLKSRHNNMVWGAMTALAEIARVNPDFIFKHLNEIKKAKEAGSVITIDNSISALAHTAAANENYNNAIFPYLLEHLSTCRPKEVPQHAERILPAVNESNKDEFIKVLKKRNDDLSGVAFTRLGRIIRLAEKIT